MPLDTSIPLQIGRAPQTQTFDPMTLYNAMQDRQMNALRSRLIEQEMAQNALTMQNTLEDRRLAAATRAQAAAQAAEERRRQAERLRIVQGGYRPERNVVIGPGTIQGSTPAGYDFAGVTNALLQRGDVDAVESLSKLQQQIAGQQKAEAEVPGIRAESRKKETEAKVAELDAAVSRYIPAVRGVSTPDDAMRLTDALYADPTLGPLLSRVAPLEQARVQAAREFAGDPMGFMRRHLLTGKELYDATVAANAPMEYSVQDTAQGVMRVPKVGTGPAIPLTDETGKPIMPADKRTMAFEPASEAVRKESGKQLVIDQTTLGNVPVTIENLEKTKALIPKARGFMGPFGQSKLEIAKFFKNSFGVDVGDVAEIRDAETLKSRLFMGVLENLKKMDSQPTQQQQVALQEALGKLSTDPDALSSVVDVMADSLRGRVELHNKRVDEAENKGITGAYSLKIELPPKPSAASTPKVAKLSDIEHTAKVNNLSVEEVKKRVRALGMAIEGE